MIIINKKLIICRDTEEVITGTTKKECYEKYLNSKHWRDLRKNIAYKQSNRCQICYKLIKKGYHIHHLTYDNIGNEKDTDLMFLCENCHNKIHNGKIKQSKVDKVIKKENFSPAVPKNYIQTNNYKTKNSTNKIKYLVSCITNKRIKNLTDEEKENFIKYLENIINK